MTPRHLIDANSSMRQLIDGQLIDGHLINKTTHTDTDIILPTLTPSRCASLLITEPMLTKLCMYLQLTKGTREPS